MTSKRTDTHKPSLLDPAEYSYLGCFYQGSSDAMAKSYMRDEQELEREIARTGATEFEGNHAAKHSCDHCGAAFAHGAVFLHTPTNTFISVGHICATDTIGLPSKAAAAKKAAEKAARAAAEREAEKARYADWREANTDVIEFLNAETEREVAYRDGHARRGPHPFINDMIHSFNRYGGLTEGQTNATRKFMLRAAEFAARDAGRDAEAAAVTAEFPTGRVTVTGEIVSTKYQDSDYGSTFKMLVKLDDGNKVWGTVPSSLDDSRYDNETGEYEDLKGTRITFTAAFEVSKDDEHFGFFKRPAKVEVLEVSAAV